MENKENLRNLQLHKKKKKTNTKLTCCRSETMDSYKKEMLR